jgi:signal transduction histidine kinase
LKLSLRIRIALAYAVLLIAVLAAASAAIVWGFQAILFDQARARVNLTMNEIVNTVQAANPFNLDAGASEAIQALLNSSNLAQWQSATTFVQIDSTNGYPLARTANLGAASIPPAPLDGRKTEQFRVVSVGDRPFLIEDRLLGSPTFAVVVHVAEPLDALYRAFRQTWETILAIIVAGAIAVVALSFFLANQALGPIVALSAAMREITSEHLDRPLPEPRRRDEIGDLTRSFNDLLARLQEAFARERQFISDASHELKTPLTSINANAQLLLRWGDEDPEIRRESLETIERESATLAAMVNGMLTLAKADRGDDIPKEPLLLARSVQEAARGSAQRASEKGLELVVDLGTESPIIEGDEALVRQLAGNLIDNAIKFTPTGRVTVTVGGSATRAWVEVADTGPGIPDDELVTIFERFYRTDKARSRDVPGTGLGLAIARSIARVHGGSVSARNAPEGGAVFHVEFPRIPATLIESS